MKMTSRYLVVTVLYGLLVGSSRGQGIRFLEKFPMEHIVKDTRGEDAYIARVEKLKESTCTKHLGGKPIEPVYVPAVEVNVINQSRQIEHVTWLYPNPKCPHSPVQKFQRVTLKKSTPVADIAWTLRGHMRNTSYLLKLKLKFAESMYFVNDRNRRCLLVTFTRLVNDPVEAKYHFTGLDLTNVTNAVLDVELRPQLTCFYKYDRIRPCFSRNSKIEAVNIEASEVENKVMPESRTGMLECPPETTDISSTPHLPLVTKEWVIAAIISGVALIVILAIVLFRVRARIRGRGSPEYHIAGGTMIPTANNHVESSS